MHREIEAKHNTEFTITASAPMAAPAWDRMGFGINSPIHHPQQDFAELAGIAGAGENLGAELNAEV